MRTAFTRSCSDRRAETGPAPRLAAQAQHGTRQPAPRLEEREVTGPAGESRYATASLGAESHYVAALPGRLDRPSVVVRSDEGDRLTGGYAVQHGKTREGSSRPAAPTAAGHFHAFVLGPAPCIAQRVSRVVLIGG